MKNGDTGFVQPMRIELATSEMEGGEYISWADPEQVVACVVSPRPAHTFSRFIEPHMTELDRIAEEEATDGAERLPARMRNLLDRLRSIHARLFRENKSLMREPHSARLTLAMVEENRVFFIKGTPCWIYLIRDGVASLACEDADRPEVPADQGLGCTDKLNFAVSSIEVQHDDLVVLLVADGGGCPDRRAVAQVFAQTQDLKRACDGLVNLLGLQSSGAGVVAVRFVPVGSGVEREIRGAGVIEDLERELVQQLSGDSDFEAEPHEAGEPAKQFEAVSAEEVPLPAFLDEAGTPEVTGSSSEQEPQDDLAADDPAPEPATAELRFPWEEGGTKEEISDEPLEIESTAVPTEHAEAIKRREERIETTPPTSAAPPFDEGGPHSGPPDRPASVLDEFPPPKKGGISKAWLISFAVVVFLMVAVIAVPYGVRLWSGKGEKENCGALRINPDPPARAIFIDGVDMATGSPAVFESIEVGAHRVKLDLGAFGTIERQVHVVDGEIIDLQPKATGTLLVTAAIPRTEAVAWVKGLPPREVPCRFDSLPVGWLDIFYEDAQVPLWQREVVIRAGQTYRVRVNNAVSSGRSLLRVESWYYSDGNGLVEAIGDSLFLDGSFAGSTPWEEEVEPGLHGVRICADDDKVWTEVVEMVAGGTRIVAPRFGMDEWPRIIHVEPGTILLGGPVLLSATIEVPGGARPRNSRLHMPAMDASVRDLPLTTVDAAEGIYVGIVNPRSLPVGRPIEYYFTVESASGETICSELYSFTVVSEVSERLAP